MAKLNKWQEEIQKLERKDDLKMNREMYHIYNDTLKEVKAKLKEYTEKYDDLPYWKQVQTGQLIKLQDEITELLNSAYPKAVDVATNFKVDQLQKGYNGVFYHAENQEGVALGFNGLNKDFVRSAVQDPVAGKKLSQRLYKRRQQLAKRAQGAITTGVLQGKGYSYMARIISANTDATYRQAMRIARTEGGRMRSIGKQKAYEEAEELGVLMQKMWVSTLDTRTRSSHQHLDGQTVGIKDDFVGLEGARAKGPRLFGDPSEDVNCRCTTVTVVNGVKPALRRDNATGEIVEFKSYKDWAKDRVKPVEEKPKLPSSITDKMTQPQQEFYNKLIAHGKHKGEATLWDKFGERLRLSDSNYSGGAHYTPVGGVKIDLQKDMQGSTINKPGNVLFHEMGHNIDDVTFNRPGASTAKWVLSNGKTFGETVYDEIQGHIRSRPGRVKAAQLSLHKELSADHAKNKIAMSSISDLFGGATNNNLRLDAGHRDSYWKPSKFERQLGVTTEEVRNRRLGSEAFAEFFAAHMIDDHEEIEMFEKWLPNSYNMYRELIERMVREGG